MENNIQVEMKRRKILIVEDSFLVCIHLQTLLEEHGYEIVATTSTAEEAVDLTVKSDPDIIFMDINLAGQMNGIEAAAIIRRHSKAAIVYLSAISELQKVELSHNEKDFYYVTKPFDDHHVLQYLDQVVQSTENKS